MNRTLIGTFAAVVASAALIGAQGSQQSGQQQTTPPQAQAQQKDNSVTLTGCLESGTTPGTFVLKNASEASSADANEMSQEKTEGTDYKIVGRAADFDLTSNLMHKVQVTGTVEDISVVTPPTNPPSRPTEQAPTKQVTLKTAKSIADRCTDLR